MSPFQLRRLPSAQPTLETKRNETTIWQEQFAEKLWRKEEEVEEEEEENDRKYVRMLALYEIRKTRVNMSWKVDFTLRNLGSTELVPAAETFWFLRPWALQEPAFAALPLLLARERERGRERVEGREVDWTSELIIMNEREREREREGTSGAASAQWLLLVIFCFFLFW